MANMRYGVAKALEEEANRLLKLGGGYTGGLVLTPDQEALRRRKELLVPSGIPDPSTRRGVYSRAANREMPHLNSRDAVAAPPRVPQIKSSSTQALADWVNEQLG